MSYKSIKTKSMKKIKLTLVLTLISVLSFSQTDFKWEKVDSVKKDKNQIYSDTKMFIAETWKSAQNVIQNDDKEGGMILIKGMTKQTINVGMGALVTFNYVYSVKFYFKEGKYKIVLDDVKYQDCGVGCDGPAWSTFGNPQDTNVGGMYKKKWEILMAQLKAELQGIVDGYEKYIQTPSANTGW